MTEFARIASLARLFGATRAHGVELGIGDDAAVLAPRSGERLVWTIDEQVEWVHFRSDLVDWHDVGWRSFMAAASDLAAMGARPWCALAALVLPADFPDEALFALAAGQQEASEAIGAPLVGGNLARGSAVSVATTLLGHARTPVRRDCAAAGELLWLAGDLGLAAAGLRGLLGGVVDSRLDAALRAWRRPVARIDAGLTMAARASAAMDISDGLVQDLGHLVRASGVRAMLDAARLLEHGGDCLAQAAAAIGADPLDLILEGGEDYAIVAASSSPLKGFVRIGEVVEGEGVFLRETTGERRVEVLGFDHFRKL
ncbi:MAG: thiamine-phosphate kinase [Myxococcales bacterium]